MGESRIWIIFFEAIRFFVKFRQFQIRVLEGTLINGKDWGKERCTPIVKCTGSLKRE